MFPESNLDTIASITFLDKDGRLSNLRVRGLLQRFNAIDFNVLVDGEFLAAIPDNASRTSAGFSDYLWLFEKASASGGSSEGASRKVAVLKLVSVEKSETSILVDLTYQRLVGGDFSDELPVALAQSVSTNEDTPKGITLAGIDADTCELTFAIASGPVNGLLTDIFDKPCVAGDPNADSASVIYGPDPNFNGEDSFTYTVFDGNGDDIATVTVTIEVVNDPPIVTLLTLDNIVVNEDASDTLINVFVAFTDVDIDTNGDFLTFEVSDNTNPSLVTGTIVGTGPDSELRLQYQTDQNGFADITVLATDDGGLNEEQEFRVTVNVVNDEPSFTVTNPNQSVLEDSGSQSVSWASGITAGPSDETGQTLTFEVTDNDKVSLFSSGPAIDSGTGNLTYTPAIDANGVATIKVELVDGGGIANFGDNTSATMTFTISVTAVNDEPSFTVTNPNQSVLEDSGSQSVSWASGITAGPSDETGQTLTFEVTDNDKVSLFSSGPAIDSGTGNLTYTPAIDANGVATTPAPPRPSPSSSVR